MNNIELAIKTLISDLQYRIDNYKKLSVLKVESLENSINTIIEFVNDSNLIINDLKIRLHESAKIIKFMKLKEPDIFEYISNNITSDNYITIQQKLDNFLA